MPIPGSDLSRWSHPRSAMASKQAHVSIRDALAADDRLSEFRHEVLLQGSLQEQYEPAQGQRRRIWWFAWPTGSAPVSPPSVESTSRRRTTGAPRSPSSCG